jgi:hypothetical protein
MVGPDLSGEGALDVDLDLAFGSRRSTRFNTPLRTGGAAFRQGSGRPGAPPPGEPFRPGRDLAARREAFAGGAPSGSLGRPGAGGGSDGAAPPVRPQRPIIPGERQFRDGDRVRHARWGDGIIVTSKLTRSDEEITVVFKDATVGRKTVLASLANLEIIG